MFKSLDEYGEILNPREVKEILRIGSNKVYDLLGSGEIKNFKIGSSRKIPKWCLIEYIERSVSGIHNEEKGDVNRYDGIFKN